MDRTLVMWIVNSEQSVFSYTIFSFNVHENVELHCITDWFDIIFASTHRLEACRP